MSDFVGNIIAKAAGFLLLIAAGFLAGCHSPKTQPQPSAGGESVTALASGTKPTRPGPDASIAARLRERATNFFSSVSMLKPPPAETPGLALQMAPLLLVVEPGAEPSGEVFSVNPRGAAPPVVYWFLDTQRIGSREHPRLTYWWRKPDPSQGQEAQGISITLNNQGFPSLWEVLRKTDGATPVYVSRQTEIAAARRYGPPLPGRAYSVESAVAHTVVVRILEDGPVPMGPLVYIDENGEILSVLCRCMPSQARQVVATANYKFLPADAAEFLPVLSSPMPGGDRLRLPEDL